MTYKFSKKTPVCKFYYKGDHSHPIRRTIIRIQSNNKAVITGYELREGSTIRSFSEAPIKSYRKDQIATYGSYSRLKAKKKRKQDSTLEMYPLETLIINGA